MLCYSKEDGDKIKSYCWSKQHTAHNCACRAFIEFEQKMLKDSNLWPVLWFPNLSSCGVTVLMLGCHHSFSEQFCCHHLPSHIPSFSKLHRHYGGLLSSDGPIGPPVIVFRLVFLSETGQSDNHTIREWTPALYMLPNIIKLWFMQAMLQQRYAGSPTQLLQYTALIPCVIFSVAT